MNVLNSNKSYRDLALFVIFCHAADDREVNSG